jgi:hypothetical protein
VTVTLDAVIGGAWMRLRVEISTAAGEIPWECVLRPGRAVCYDLLARGAPELGRLLHEKGWGPHGMVPFGFSGPVFLDPTRVSGAAESKEGAECLAEEALTSAKKGYGRHGSHS